MDDYKRRPEAEVEIDPRRCFGQAHIRGIKTAAIWERWLAGEPLTEIADDFGLTYGDTEKALRVEWLLERRIDEEVCIQTVRLLRALDEGEFRARTGRVTGMDMTDTADKPGGGEDPAERKGAT